MELQIRPMSYEERKYTYAQSSQLKSQTGSIGHLRGDFGSGEQFYTSWFEHDSKLKTPEFSSELDEVVNELRSKGGLLNSRRSMVDYAKDYPESRFKGAYTTEYGFRVDTETIRISFAATPPRVTITSTASATSESGWTIILTVQGEIFALLTADTRICSACLTVSKSPLPARMGKRGTSLADISTMPTWRLGTISITSASLRREWSAAAAPTSRKKHRCPVIVCPRSRPPAR